MRWMAVALLLLVACGKYKASFMTAIGMAQSAKYRVSTG